MFDRPNEAEPVSRFSDWSTTGNDPSSTTGSNPSTSESVPLRRAAGTWHPGSCYTSDTSFTSSHDNKKISLAKGGSPVKSTCSNFPQSVLDISLVSNKPIPISISDSALTKKK